MTVIRDAIPQDFRYIESLRLKESQSLGFIPRDAYLSILERRPIQGTSRHLYSRILVTVDSGDLTGFCYVSYAASWAHIFQLVIQQDARRWHRALLMTNVVEADALAYGKRGVSCRVAYELESNYFWRAAGYDAVQLIDRPNTTRKRPLWLYQKEITGLFLLDATSTNQEKR